MKIAVVIPTYKYHIPLLKRTLESIVNQTRIPEIVVIRASSCDDETTPILNDIRKDKWPFHLNILETTAKQFTGQNRNEGIIAVPDDIDIISNFDSDDIMHPRRLEYIEEMIIQGADAVVHDFLTTSNPDTISWDLESRPEAIYNRVIKDVSCTTFYISKPIDIKILAFLNENNQECRYNDGNISVRKDLYNIIQYESDAKGYQDAKFICDLYRLGCNVVLLQNKLILYSEESEDRFAKKHHSLCIEHRV
jgi:glycosyltransferase involved in cell wall biosynthesis